MLKILREVDPELLKLNSGSGQILISNRLQGRIFAAFGGDLVHRLVADLACHPDPVEFNNLGGNSLWPAPEGGDYAYNYPPAGTWRVQAGINSVPTVTIEADEQHVVVAKNIELINRKGKTLQLKFQRQINPLTAEEMPGAEYNVQCTGYRSVDELIPLSRYDSDEALLGAWSLEQFPGAEGITAFGRCEGSAIDCANSDFYGDPGERLAYRGNLFRFELGGDKRLQIGIKVDSNPVLIGALDWQRGILAVRITPKRFDGKYFNIADNDQLTGPYGAADRFSIFNGAQELNFYELETIAPMNVEADGSLGKSTLESTTILMKGEQLDLMNCLSEYFGVEL